MECDPYIADTNMKPMLIAFIVILMTSMLTKADNITTVSPEQTKKPETQEPESDSRVTQNGGKDMQPTTTGIQSGPKVRAQSILALKRLV